MNSDYRMNDLFYSIDNEMGRALEGQNHLNTETQVFKEENPFNFEEYATALPSIHQSLLDSSVGNFGHSSQVPQSWSNQAPYPPAMMSSMPMSASQFGDFSEQRQIDIGKLHHPGMFYAEYAQPMLHPGKVNRETSNQSIVDVERLKEVSKIAVELDENGQALDVVDSPIRPSKRRGVVTHIYRCPWAGCEKTFSRFYNLNSHYHTHTGERPFQCDICSFRFARKHDLNRHKRCHTGQKPFVCPVCQKSFSRQDAMQRHLKINSHHCGTQISNATMKMEEENSLPMIPAMSLSSVVDPDVSLNGLV